jgi:hypothetical protein
MLSVYRRHKRDCKAGHPLESEFDERKKDGSLENARSSNSTIAKFMVNMAYVHGGVLDVAVKIAMFDLCLSLLHTLAMSVRTGSFRYFTKG